MSRDDVDSPAVEDSVDSSSSVSLGSGNNSNSNNNNNNVLPLFLSQSAELYYKQLLAATANVAALAKPRLAASVRTTLAKTTLALDQKAAFVWEGSQHGGGGGAGVSGGHGKCGGPAGGQGQGGLVHWMSAVMAEHMNNVGTNHHDGIHYMWNSGVEQCGPHGKDMDYSWGRQPMAKQGYEAKMTTDQQNNHGVDDGRMDPAGALGGLYGSTVRTHSSSSSSASPPHGAATLIVPHPLAASKHTPGDQHHVVTHNGSGRKYQCKMCPSMAGAHPHHHHAHAHAHAHAHSMYTPEKLQRPPLLNSQIFGSKSELQLHSQLHMREVKPYKCSQCSKTFANSSYLSQHTRIHLGIKPYRCEICQRKFTQLSHLQQHIRTHTGDKPYKCRHPNCNKAFSQLSNLQSHSRCHQTDKPYKCNSCYKCFSDEPSLLEHIPKHKESKHLKTHICQYCGKSYTQETYLTKHMQKHAERTDKRPPIIGIPRVTFETPHYWPKVSPDTANTLVDAMSQQDYHQANGLLQEHGMNGEDHRQPPPTPTPTPVPTGYHDKNNVNTSSASAFTPIQSMGVSMGVGVPSHHHNHHLNHHQPAYLSYNALTFPSSKVVTSPSQLQTPQTSVAMEMPKSVSSNSFPNQLISLHQIRNYAHQPAPSLMSTEHILTGLKDKTQ